MPQLISRTGKVIDLRPPQLGDENILFDYAQKMQNEDTFVLLNPNSPVTYTEEETYLADSLRKIAAVWQIHYLAFFQGNMIGSCQITKQGRRKMHSGSFGISLLPEFRHDSLGFQLSNLVLSEAKMKLGLQLATLEVFSGNLPAYSLYQKLGFVPYGRIPNGLQYRGGYNDAIYMYKTLV